MKAIIEKLYDNEKTLVFVLNGERYSLFKEDYEPEELNYSEGDEIEFEFKQRGDYKNITKIKKLSSGFKNAEDISGRNIQIVRQACLKAAVEISKTADEAIETAEKFVKWVIN